MKTVLQNIIILIFLIANNATLAQVGVCKDLENYFLTKEVIEKIDSNGIYKETKKKILSIDLQYVDDFTMYDLAIFALKNSDTSTFFHLINEIPPSGFSGCFNKTYCLKTFLKEDFLLLDKKNLMADVYQKALTIFEDKIDTYSKMYSTELQKICDSLRQEDQKIRWDLVKRYSELSYDSIQILMEPQNKIDSSNSEFMDNLISIYGFPLYDKVDSDVFGLLLMHIQNPDKYMPFISELVKQHKMNWTNYVDIFYRYHTFSLNKFIEFPFVGISKNNEMYILEKSFHIFKKKTETYFRKYNFKIHFYVSTANREMQLRNILLKQGFEEGEIHTTFGGLKDDTVYFLLYRGK